MSALEDLVKTAIADGWTEPREGIFAEARDELLDMTSKISVLESCVDSSAKSLDVAINYLREIIENPKSRARYDAAEWLGIIDAAPAAKE